MRKTSRYFWGMGNIGEGVVSMVTSTYFIVFLTDTAMLPLRLVSAITILGSILDFILVPLSGAILESTRPMKWGRYRSWLLICPPIVIVFYLLCFTIVDGSHFLTAVCALLGYIGGKTAWNIAYTANISLTAVLSVEEKTTTKFTSQRMMGSNIGRMLGNSLTPAIVAAIAVHLGEANGYRLTILIMGTVYLLTSLLHFYICGSCGDGKPSKQAAGMTLREIARVVAVEPRILATMLIDLTSNVASLVLPTLAVFYYKCFTNGPAMTSTHMLVIGFGGLAGASVIRALGNRIRNAKVVLICIYSLVACLLLSIRLFPDSIGYFLLVGALVAILTGMTSPVELALYMNHAVSYQEKTGQNATAFIMGLSNFPVKFASLIKSTLIPFMLMFSGYVAHSEPTAQMKQAIVNSYTLIPALFPITGIVLLALCYKPRKQTSKQ